MAALAQNASIKAGTAKRTGMGKIWKTFLEGSSAAEDAGRDATY